MIDKYLKKFDEKCCEFSDGGVYVNYDKTYDFLSFSLHSLAREIIEEIPDIMQSQEDPYIEDDMTKWKQQLRDKYLT